jgi:hypothetical protein
MIMKNIIKNKEENICSICGKKYGGYGNNAQPVSSGRCCDICNMLVIIPTRARHQSQYMFIKRK